MYARGEGVGLADMGLTNVDDLCAALRRDGYDFLIVDLSEIGSYLPDVNRDALDARLEPVVTASKEWQANDGEVVIYKVTGGARFRAG